LKPAALVIAVAVAAAAGELLAWVDAAEVESLQCKLGCSGAEASEFDSESEHSSNDSPRSSAVPLK
jgi:hypothetical protein